MGEAMEHDEHEAHEEHESHLIQDGDSIFLRAHTGKRLTVQGDRVHAKWDQQGSWQSLVVEREEGPGPVWSGDRIFLRAHTGKRISVQGDNLHAKWGNKGSWEEALTIERDDANIGPLLVGD